MISKQMIMREWREFVVRKDAMTDMYTRAPEPCAPYDPDALPPGSPARAPASLAEHEQQVQEA
jgi:hypothetical protein